MIDRLDIKTPYEAPTSRLRNQAVKSTANWLQVGIPPEPKQADGTNPNLTTAGEQASRRAIRFRAICAHTHTLQPCRSIQPEPEFKRASGAPPPSAA
ncbi:hypothetical protein CDD83_409 [Cordyceps sp. RAO-2017]|nr:hypothetical protein CDD83_409 [Cordyceps sp. RAO-2017]